MAKRKGANRHTQRILNLAIQSLHIQKQFPQFSHFVQGGWGLWKGFLQPRFSSPKYLVEVEYRLQLSPKVRVLSPVLHPRAVHLYANKNLCLYWPKEWIWKPDRLIAQTIIPWTGSWLFFYEIWLDTDKWLGPSSHEYFPLK